MCSVKDIWQKAWQSLKTARKDREAELAENKARIPLISMSVGPLGSVTRMVGGLFGSWLSFAVGESASAPGQIPIGALVTVFDIIRRARCGEMF